MGLIKTIEDGFLTSLETNNADSALHAIKEVDIALTQTRDPSGNDEGNRTQILEFLDQSTEYLTDPTAVLTLSDGYSRIAVLFEPPPTNKFTIQMTENSLPETVARWNQLK